MNHTLPEVIDLFAGVGGISLGAVRAGFALPLAVELDHQALSAHSRNFPTTTHLEIDISSITGDVLLDTAKIEKGELDGLIGGPPCQGFSVIGHRNAEDPRNSLFVKFFELVSECLPAFFVAENVPGILADKFKNVREQAFDCIDSSYLVSEPIRLKASDFGAPTSRERVFFIGCRSDMGQSFSARDFEAKKTQSPITVGKAIEGLPTFIDETWLTEEQSWKPVQVLSPSDYATHIQGHIPNGVGDSDALARYHEQKLVSGCFGTRHSCEVVKRYEGLRQGEKDKISKSVRLELDGFCPTLRAGTGPERGRFQAVRPIHPTLPRVITPREAARLQGFPDWFQFAPSKWHSFRQIGNSVSPILAEAIFEVIFERLYAHIGI